MWCTGPRCWSRCSPVIRRRIRRLAILVVLYPAARWFADVKRRRREWWLKFL
jgi:hypothetical protein